MKPKTSHCQVPSGVLRNSILRWKRVRLLGWFARQILLASAVTRLAADVPPTITAQPQSQTATAGANVTFAVTADGTAPLGYQWRKSGATLTDGGNVSGAATAALTLANVRLGDAGNYDVVVSNGLGTNISRAATLTVTIFPRPIPSRPTSFPLGVPSIPTIQGAVIAWGWNYFGQTTVPSGLTNVVAIAGGFSHSLALQADGAVVEWGRETVPSGLTNVVAIAAGSSHDLALQADGTVVAWGSDFWGQTDVPPDLTNVVAIAGGGQHSLALQADGAVVAWGDNEFGQTDVPPGLTNVVAIAGGFRHSLALQADGTVVAWGANESGETTIPSSLTNVVAIAGGGQHNLALQAGGTVVAWGDDAWGERDVPSDLTNVVAIAEGECYSLALKADGTMVAWGRGSYGEATVPLGLTNVVAIAGGFHHSLALVGGVLVPISITSPPQDQTVMAGTSVTLSVVASGTRPISYQWRLEGADISGATGPDYPIASVQPSDAGAYTVVVGNVLNSVTSAPPALLTVLAPPTITAQPQSQTAVAGTNVSFTVTADGTVPLSYQWQFNAVNLVNGGRISGADTASLSLVNVHSADTGNYTVVVTNAYGSATSQVAVLTVTGSNSSVHYVDGGSANPVSPYANWATAARTIQDAVVVAVDGDTVLVTNGVYLLDNQIAITNGITVTSVNGPQVTVVDGGYPARTNRCFVLSHARAVLEGFTIRGGYAHLGGGVRMTASDLANDRFWVWATPAYDEVNPPVLDADGNLYVAGGAYGDSNRVFVEKYAPGGARLWTTELRSDAGPSCLHLDGLGHLYVGGCVGPSGSLGNLRDAYLVKLDLQGNVLWEHTWGSDSHDFVYGLQTDTAGNVYASGYTWGDIDGAPEPGNDDLFLSQFTPEGDRPWTRLYGTWTDEALGLLLPDGQNGFYLVGYGREPGPYDFRFARLTADGTEVWTHLVGIPGRNEWVEFAGTDSGGSVYAGGRTDGATNAVTGALESGLYLAKLGLDGSTAWTQCWDLPDVAVTGLTGAVDPTGNVYVAAPGEMTADGIIHPRSDIYLWKISSAGDWQWCKPFGIGTNAYLAGLTLDGAGGLFLDWYSYGGFEGHVNAGLYDSYLGHWTFDNPFGGLVSRCIVEDNQAEQGGGVALGQLGGLRNCLIAANTASGLGGGVYSQGGTVESSTLSGNSAQSGAGLYADGPVQVVNSILYGNTAGAWADCASSDASAMVSYSLVGTGIVPGTGNITGDPQFANPAGSDYRLAPGSPCVDTGTNLAWMTGAMDLKGGLRVQGLAVDMGAYEQSGNCVPPPVGLVAWWPAEGNANDIIGGNNGTLTNGATFASGMVGQAFLLNGNNHVEVADSPGLRPAAFTVEAWVQPFSFRPAYFDTVVSKGQSNFDPRLPFGDDSLWLGFADGKPTFYSHHATSGLQHLEAPQVAPLNQWLHLAATFDGSVRNLFVNGAVVGSGAAVGEIVYDSAPVPWLIGQDWVAGHPSNEGFNGLIDEVRLYSLALTAEEIRGIYQAGSAGVCRSNSPPAVAITEPADGAVVTAGNDLVITATASDTDGTVTQVEFFAGTNSLGAVSASPFTRVWTNVPAGSYVLTAVATDNQGATNTSAPVNFTVTTPICLPRPPGLVAWWPGDGNANDIIGGNNGTLTNGATFAAGKVGQAFSFNTNHAGVLVGNPASLQLQDFTIEAWIRRGSTAFTTDDPTAVQAAANLFCYGSQGYTLGVFPNGTLYLSKVDVDAVSAGPGVTDTNFHHVAVTKSGTSVTFYIDRSGYPVAAPYTDTFQFTTPAAIGGRGDTLNGNNNSSFCGTIDELSIYNRALSSNEIAAIYSAGSAGKCFTFVNQAPSFVKGLDVAVNENAGPQTIANWATAVSPGPPNETGQKLTFTVTNNNNGLFAVQPVLGTNGTLTFTPAANSNGVATVTVVLKDDGGTANGGHDTSGAQTFTITVVAVNQVPSFVKGADITVNENAGAQTIANWATAISAGPPNEAGQKLTFTLTNNNNGLFAVQPALGTNGTVTFTPAANASGMATVTVVLKDDGGTANGGHDTSASQSFTITVRAVNQAPSFTEGPNVAVNENAGVQTVANWATGISAGPANEAGQKLTFTVTNNNNGLFAVQPVLGTNGTLTFTPAANSNGVATVTVVLKDDGGTTNGGHDTSAPQIFTITVRLVNQPPVLGSIPSQTVTEGQLLTFTATATDPDTPPQKLTFTLGTNAPAGATIDPASGLFRWTPPVGLGGSTLPVTVIVTDNGTPPLNDQTNVTITVNVAIPPAAIHLTQPVNGELFVAGTDVLIVAEASGGQTPPQHVDLLANGDLLKSAEFAPYSVLWTGVPAGTNQIMARAVYGDGTTRTDQVQIVVVAVSKDVAVVHNQADNPELATITSSLDGMSLARGYDVFALEAVSFTNLLAYNVIIWDDLTGKGLSSQQVDLFSRLFAAGRSLYFIGGSLTAASQLDPVTLTNWYASIHLQPGTGSGGDGTVHLTTNNSITINLGHGEVYDFALPPLTNVVQATGLPGEQVIGRSGDSALLVTYRPSEVGQRSFTQDMPVVSGTNDYSLTERQLLFVNVVCWLLPGGCPCASGRLYSDTRWVPESALVGASVTNVISLWTEGECHQFTDVTLLDELPDGLRLVDVEPASVSWQLNGALLTCDLGTVPGQTTVNLIVVPLKQGAFTNTIRIRADQFTQDLQTNGTITVQCNGALCVVTPPQITSQPTNQTVPVGGSATFQVIAEGTPPLGYQWFFKQTNVLDGATSASLHLTGIGANQAGPYSVVVTNLAGSVVSQNAWLNVVDVQAGSLLAVLSFDSIALKLRVTGVPGQDYVLERSSDLTRWDAAQTNRAANGVVDFTEALPSSNQRFYRARTLP